MGELPIVYAQDNGTCFDPATYEFFTKRITLALTIQGWLALGLMSPQDSYELVPQFP